MGLFMGFIREEVIIHKNLTIFIHLGESTSLLVTEDSHEAMETNAMKSCKMRMNLKISQVLGKQSN